MFLLIATIIFAGVISFIAMQNATPVDLHLSKYHLANIPLYWIVLASVLLTLIFSWIMLLINSISNSFALHGKDNIVNHLKKENVDLKKKIQQLETENSRRQEERRIKTTEN